tara:strand:+ start:53 stop:268 length:216 start_codon:yes stop_codon:yes gene_type:complete
MTNSGMFEDAEKIIYLENQNKLLKKKLREAVKIDKDHQELNGKLHKEIETLKKDIEIIREGNEHLGIIRQN